MRTILSRLVATGVLLLVPIAAQAQDASLNGTIADSTGGVLPGVTVTALHVASGNTFVGVSDERGNYRIAARTGQFNVTAELSGFASVTRTIELLVGQQALLNLQMAPSTVQETVTVTSQAPLVDTTQSKLGGNIDPVQIRELPVNGRNFMTLTLLVPGSRANDVLDSPGGNFKVNVDGQQISSIASGGVNGEPRFSQDAIAEFEMITTRFDATQGRTSGVQVNAVTKSGTNVYSGTVAGYFRDANFNAADFIARRVLPYSDTQVSTTFGGPILKDRLHFFSNYEGEREPQTLVFNTPYPSFNIQNLKPTRKEKKAGTRLDYQFSSQVHLMARGNLWRQQLPNNTGLSGVGGVNNASVHPSGILGSDQASDELFFTLTETLGTRAVNEIKGGYNSQNVAAVPVDRSFGGDLPSGPDLKARFYSSSLAPGLLIPLDGFAPRIILTGFALGSQSYAPYYIGDDHWQIRDNFTYLLSAAGQHEFKVGGEYLSVMSRLWLPNYGHGIIDATGGPIPANLEQLFPVWNDWTTWNLAALSPITRGYQLAFGNFNIYDPRHTGAVWSQDNWTVNTRLTLNLGVRYDVSIGALGEYVGPIPPFRNADQIHHDLLNLVPRLGFAYALSGSTTVIRGGYGRYYSEPSNSATGHYLNLAAQTVSPTTLNDGRANFTADPFNGRIPTFDSILASGAQRNINAGIVLENDTYRTPYSEQASIGFEHQIGETMSIESDYAWVGDRRVASTRNANLTYNPVTGANYPFNDIAHLKYPQFGIVAKSYTDGRANDHRVTTVFNKRLSRRWRASANYTLSARWDESGTTDMPSNVVPDLGGEYTLSAGDQRHRAVVNGIWDAGHGFQLSGLYFFGSGLRYGTSYGGDRRAVGAGGIPGIANTARLRPDGTIVPRNNFVGTPIHRVDFRLQRHFRLRNRVGADGMLDVFNLFNHDNYGSYVTAESNARYGQATQNTNIAYQPRMAQLGFRFLF